jgi:hypothetical protein
MKEKEIYETLKFFLNKIKWRKLIWRLNGSANLFVQGVKISPKDIDITTTPKDYKKFKLIFKDLIKKEDFEKDKGWQFILLDINGIELEIGYHREIYLSLDMISKIKQIRFLDLNLNILSLEDSNKFYSIIHDSKKIKLIKEFIQKK